MSSAYDSIAARVIELDFVPLAIMGASVLGVYYYMTMTQSPPIPNTKCQTLYDEFKQANDANFVLAEGNTNDRDLFFWQWCQKFGNENCFDNAPAGVRGTYCSSHKCRDEVAGDAHSDYPYDPVVGVNWAQYDSPYAKGNETMINRVGTKNAFCAVGCYQRTGDDKWTVGGPPLESCLGGRLSSVPDAFNRGGYQTCVDSLELSASPPLAQCGAPPTRSTFEVPKGRERCACDTLAFLSLPNPKEYPSLCPVRVTATGEEIHHTTPDDAGKVFKCPPNGCGGAKIKLANPPPI